jgi:hypothetical protein
MLQANEEWDLQFLDEEEWAFQYLEEDLTEDFTEPVLLPEIAYLKEDAVESSIPQERPCLHATHERGIFASGQFLYWKLDEVGLDFVVHKKQGTAVYVDPLTSRTVDQWVGKVHQVNFDWNPGFRAALGYRFPRDLWELGAVYTYYYTSASEKIKTTYFYPLDAPNTIPDAEALAPTLPRDIHQLIFAKASAHFWYHVGDVELGREFALTRYIWGRFVVGGKGAWIKQKFHVKMADGTSPTPEQFEFNDFNWKFEGGGAKIGFDSHWALGCGLKLVFGGELASLYGLYENRMKGHIQPSPVVPGGVVADTRIKEGKVVYTSRLSGGVELSWWFRGWNVALFGNYELNTWFNLTDQYRDVSAASPAAGNAYRSLQTPPLNLQGATAGINIYF